VLRRLLALLSIGFLGIAASSAATAMSGAAAASFIYDSAAITHLDTQSLGHAGASPTQVPEVQRASASPAIDVRGTSTRSFRSVVATNTASGVSRTQLFRSVEPGELADLAGSGQFRTIAGQEGKYFFPTRQQAAAFDDIISGQAAVTSGKINSSILSGVEQITISGEGAAWFIPEELLPYIDDIVIHGAP
jgi:hypothetical protein